MSKKQNPFSAQQQAMAQLQANALAQQAAAMQQSAFYGSGITSGSALTIQNLQQAMAQSAQGLGSQQSYGSYGGWAAMFGPPEPRYSVGALSCAIGKEIYIGNEKVILKEVNEGTVIVTVGKFFKNVQSYRQYMVTKVPIIDDIYTKSKLGKLISDAD
jgi:hypothetical protein